MSKLLTGAGHADHKPKERLCGRDMPSPQGERRQPGAERNGRIQYGV
ncbi:MAG TPA: hypothetical protein VIH45_08500 [Desulfuromonadaceae bacterium]